MLTLSGLYKLKFSTLIDPAKNQFFMPIVIVEIVPQRAFHAQESLLRTKIYILKTKIIKVCCMLMLAIISNEVELEE